MSGKRAMIGGMSNGETRELIHRGRKYDFERVSSVTPGGRDVSLEIVRHPGAVCVVALAEAGVCPEGMAGGEHGGVVLITNYRVTVQKELWEVPAGTKEVGESAAVCAGRELEEETGFSAGVIEPIASFYTTPGMTDELMHAFFARDLAYVGQRLEADEEICVSVVAVEEALAMVERGEVVDGKTMTALLLAERRGLFGR